ncbi:MAG TPA: hypothetical protein VIM51_07785 [Desulfosporosinus sp.]
MLKKKVNSNFKKLFAVLMVLMMVLSIAPVALAAGTNPISFLGANLTTTNHLTETDPLQQISTPGVSLIDNNGVPSGPQSIDVNIDKNFITDAIYIHNEGCITLQDVTTSSNVPVSFFRLGATDGTGVYKTHLYFDVNLVAGHAYQIRIDTSLVGNNGLTLAQNTTANYPNPICVNFAVAPAPAKPGAPVVTSDDTLNTVSGMASGMEYKLDVAGYVAYDKTTFDALDFSGTHTLLVRVAAAGINPASDAVTLNFTANAVSVKPASPVVTNDDTLNTVTGMAAGMEYKLDAADYVAYDMTTFAAINLSGAHTLLVRVAAAGINPVSDAATLSFTANVVSVKPETPVVTNDDTLNTVTGMAPGMEYKLDAAGYVAYDNTTFAAINFSGAHTLLVRVASAGINPASDAVTLNFTANTGEVLKGRALHLKTILDRLVKAGVITQAQEDAIQSAFATAQKHGTKGEFNRGHNGEFKAVIHGHVNGGKVTPVHKDDNQDS